MEMDEKPLTQRIEKRMETPSRARKIKAYRNHRVEVWTTNKSLYAESGDVATICTQIEAALRALLHDHREYADLYVNHVWDDVDICSVCHRKWEVYEKECANCGAPVEEDVNVRFSAI